MASTLSMALVKVPIALSVSSRSITAPSRSVVSISKLGTLRLSSQFHGTKLNSGVRKLNCEKRRLHGAATAYMSDDSAQKNEDMDSLKASQIKKVRLGFAFGCYS